MPSLRTPESKKKYKQYLQETLVSDTCPLCEKEALKIFTYWKIVENSFPYDLIADVHHMILPYRHVKEGDLNVNELSELRKIKEEVMNIDYDYILESTAKTKSLPAHFHLHLLVGKS